MVKKHIRQNIQDKVKEMNVLFLTLSNVKDINDSGIYEDLLRQFIKNGHCVYVVSPTERRYKEHSHIIQEKDGKVNTYKILKVSTGNIQKTNIIEKGISTILIESQFKSAIKKYFVNVRFDLIIYSTPPITLAGVVKYIKKRDNAQSYLLLKDIFPQNAVDIGMMNKKGIKGILYKYFRAKEKKLYALSDCIGCMSPANMDFIIKHNPNVDKQKVEVCPNCIEPRDMSITQEERIAIREKYGIPIEKKVFVYGGNLGKPQGISFLIECLKSQQNNKEVFFFIVGDGTEYRKIETFINEDKPNNIKLVRRLLKEDYDYMIAACDVGMIFLDHRFTIPNFPSRLLSYMQAKLPVLCATDPNTDIGKIAIYNDFGWWCESNDVSKFNEIVDKACTRDLKVMSDAAWDYMKREYTAEVAYKIILEGIGRNREILKR